MTEIAAAGFGVLGTLLGSMITYLFQQRSAGAAARLSSPACPAVDAGAFGAAAVASGTTLKANSVRASSTGSATLHTAVTVSGRTAVPTRVLQRCQDLRVQLKRLAGRGRPAEGVTCRDPDQVPDEALVEHLDHPTVPRGDGSHAQEVTEQLAEGHRVRGEARATIPRVLQLHDGPGRRVDKVEFAAGQLRSEHLAG